MANSTHSPLALRLIDRKEARFRHQSNRSNPKVSGRSASTYDLPTGNKISFCSNDYLGYGAETLPVPNSVAQSGSSGSPLVCGYSEHHRLAEQKLAHLLGTEAAALLPSGYQANIAAAQALIGTADHVYSDALNHASLIDAIRLAKPEHKTVLDHLQRPGIRTHSSTECLKWWILESTYSMDGDSPQIEHVIDHVQNVGPAIVDRSHDIGLARVHEQTTKSEPDIVYTAGLGKAPGLAGGIVAGTEQVINEIRNSARAYIYSTAIPPLMAAAIAQRVDQLSSDDADARRKRLESNIQYACELLKEIPGARINTERPIQAVVTKDNQATLQAADNLLQRGWHVQAIRPPTVPPGTSRLRITLTSTHTHRQIDGLIQALRRALKRNQD